MCWGFFNVYVNFHQNASIRKGNIRIVSIISEHSRMFETIQILNKDLNYHMQSILCVDHNFRKKCYKIIQ